MKRQIFYSDLVPIRESAFQLPPNKTTGDKATEKAERRTVLNIVREQRCSGRIRLHRVSMNPLRKRTADLGVDELSSRFDVRVPGDPCPMNRPDLHPQPGE